MVGVGASVAVVVVSARVVSVVVGGFPTSHLAGLSRDGVIGSGLLCLPL